MFAVKNFIPFFVSTHLGTYGGTRKLYSIINSPKMSIAYAQALANFIRNGDAFSQDPGQQQSYLGSYYQQPITSANTTLSYGHVQQQGYVEPYYQQSKLSANAAFKTPPVCYSPEILGQTVQRNWDRTPAPQPIAVQSHYQDNY